MPLPILGILPFIGKAIDKIFPDKEKQEEAKRLMLEAQNRGELDELNAEMQVMLAEAKSTDKWTSRARPSFLYVIYFMIIMSVPIGIVYCVNPNTAFNLIEGVRLWFTAIPKELYTLFGIGYLGYTGAREYGKKKLLDTIGNIGR